MAYRLEPYQGRRGHPCRQPRLFGGGEIFAENSLKLSLSDPALSSRTPDIIVAPNLGVAYTRETKKVSEHGGFTNDDRTVLLIAAKPRLSCSIYTGTVETRQVAPAVQQAVGYDPGALQAVQKEGTEIITRSLPGGEKIEGWQSGPGAGRNRGRSRH